MQTMDFYLDHPSTDSTHKRLAQMVKDLITINQDSESTIAYLTEEARKALSK